MPIVGPVVSLPAATGAAMGTSIPAAVIPPVETGWGGPDPRQTPVVPAAVDVHQVDGTGKIMSIVAKQVMPYEVRDFITYRCPSVAGRKYEMAAAGKYAVGATFAG